jgi:anti-sigma B factor antagonist
MRGFGLTIEPLAGGAVCVALRGELDLEHAYTFDEELRRVEGGRPHCLVLDLRGLSFLDSCGLARLLAARRRARREKRRLLLVRGSAPVQRLMAITAVRDHFETVSEVPEELRATAGLAGQLQ